jgi:hypothetical protein
MLTIQPAQMQSLGRMMRERFVSEEIARVRRERPAQAVRVDDERIRAFIEHAIARAAAYGLVQVSEVQRFIDLNFRLGPDFEQRTEHQAVCVLLEATEVAGQLRLDRVDRLLAQQGNTPA